MTEQDFLSEFKEMLTKINPKDDPDIYKMYIIFAFIFSYSLYTCYTKMVIEMAKANSGQELSEIMCEIETILTNTSQTLLETYKTKDSDNVFFSKPETSSIN